ncbi:MAG: tRNA 2-thiocytidine biosynthesis protein TtcA [Clostridia bacterium]|nr:tRNA 2-thiocytidine biosynthesis protein TtcA [Clostridia bacterium]
MERYKEIERSIITTYRKKIWGRFVRGIKEYRMVSEGDRIAVCISGGKDSMLLAKCMQELVRHSPVKFGLEFIVMDPGYAPANRQRIIDNAAILNIPISIFNSDVFAVSEKLRGDSPCYLCARMRRGFLYERAKELGCNKIALGHHFDDVIETLLINMIYGAQIGGMLPRLKSTSHEGMELIRPLYYVKEQDIINWSKFNNLEFIRCACSFTEKGAGDENLSKRKEIKGIIEELRRGYPNVDINLFRSAYNVHVDTLISWDSKGKSHSFMERFDDTYDDI